MIAFNTKKNISSRLVLYLKRTKLKIKNCKNYLIMSQNHQCFSFKLTQGLLPSNINFGYYTIYSK